MADKLHTASSPAPSAPSPTHSPVSGNRRGRTLSRIAEVIHNETVGLHLSLRLLSLPLALLPHFAFNRVRTALYRLAGVSIGPGSLVLGSIELAGPGRIQKRLKIGSHTQITTPLYADVCAEITIGDQVYIGHHAVFITTNHEIGPESRRCGDWKSAPITIESGAWIGARVTLLPGVTVGRGAVVAAGAVVSRDVAPNTLVGGVPAKVIRELPTQ